MPYRKLSTKKVAEIAGVHPNTVRLYESWGYLPPIPRAANGYRQYTEAHIDQLRLARKVMSAPWLCRPIRRVGVDLVLSAAKGDLSEAQWLAYEHLKIVESELAQAEQAAGVLARWAAGQQPDEDDRYPLQIKEAARALDLSTDVLRNWERNGLIDVPRNPLNRYRLYGAAEMERLRVLRILLRSGYSTMAVLRAMLRLEGASGGDYLRSVLDTPREDEDVLSAADRWITSLQSQRQRAQEIIELVEEMIKKQ